MSRAGIKLSEVSSKRIVRVVCDYYNIDTEYVSNKNRLRKYAIPRFICMFLIKEKTNLTLSEIGRLFNRDHATTIHAIRKVKDLIEFDKQLKQELWEIKLRLS